jgi:histidinol phosphatase-like PHP family hydrolase
VSYLYETHLHTSQASACANSRGRDYISVYRDLGYTGIIVTDHFIHGNSALDDRQPWRDWVSAFCRGYEEARDEGEKQGLDVFFGWEETFDGDDYLVYGLDKAWLLEHPEPKNWTRKRQYETVRQYGGCVVHAHPFRQARYIPRITLCPAFIDAVEVANAGNPYPSWNALAFRYAQKIGLPVTAGSDIHHACDAFDKSFGVYLDKKLTSIADYVAAIRDKTIAGIRADDHNFQGSETVSLPLMLLDSREKGRQVKNLTELWSILP